LIKSKDPADEGISDIVVKGQLIVRESSAAGN
jgi:hypothetical protein